MIPGVPVVRGDGILNWNATIEMQLSGQSTVRDGRRRSESSNTDELIRIRSSISKI